MADPAFKGETPPQDAKAEPQGDPRPRAQARPRRAATPKPAATRPSTKVIEDALAQMLTMPSIPCALAGDDWAANHFATNGKALAKQIATVSEHNEPLRRMCEKMLAGETVGVLVIGFVMYAYPPLLHWGIAPGGEAAAGLLGVPVVKREKAPPNGTPPSQHTRVPGSQAQA